MANHTDLHIHTQALRNIIPSTQSHGSAVFVLLLLHLGDRESMFVVLSWISTVLTPTAEKQPGPLKVDLLEGRETTGRCHREINLPPLTAWK